MTSPAPAPLSLPVSGPLTVLGIESSCDETAAAVLRLEPGAEGGPARPVLLSEIVRSQVERHAPYGGVVPEIAARAHAEICDRVVLGAVEAAGADLGGFAGLDAVAATSGPGLVGGVMVGMMTGKAVAQARGIPFLPINHLEGHALSPRLGGDCPFPYLLLLVSGGHCQLLEVAGLGRYRRLGSTVDDAAGEAFDKAAKVLGLPQPGGPAVERAAKAGDAGAVALPRPMLRHAGLQMSFAGLKTAVARAAEEAPLSEARVADIAASAQAAIADILEEKTRRALELLQGEGSQAARRLVVAGGVAANAEIRGRLEALASARGAAFTAPPLRHCTDNAAMIALAGAERLAAGLFDGNGLSASARPRWPLDEASALSDPLYGSGKKGAKA